MIFFFWRLRISCESNHVNVIYEDKNRESKNKNGTKKKEKGEKQTKGLCKVSFDCINSER